jgi:hypothetical protein
MQLSDLTLIPNPHAELILVREADVIRAITVLAPVRRQGRTVTRIEREKEPEVFGTLLVSTIHRDGFRPASETSAVKERLAEIGFLVPENQVSNPVWFACDIDDPPLDLIPRRATCTGSSGPVEDLVVNPTFRRFGDAGPQSQMREQKHLANRFRTDCSWIWLEDAILSAPCVYWPTVRWNVASTGWCPINRLRRALPSMPASVSATPVFWDRLPRWRINERSGRASWGMPAINWAKLAIPSCGTRFGRCSWQRCGAITES